MSSFPLISYISVCPLVCYRLEPSEKRIKKKTLIPIVHLLTVLGKLHQHSISTNNIENVVRFLMIDSLHMNTKYFTERCAILEEFYFHVEDKLRLELELVPFKFYFLSLLFSFHFCGMRMIRTVYDKRSCRELQLVVTQGV